MDGIGRKWVILIGSILTAAGIGVQVGSNNWKEFLAGRLVNCKSNPVSIDNWKRKGENSNQLSSLALGFGMVFIISPVWIGENARPELRGFFLCLMNGSIVLGQFVLA